MDKCSVVERNCFSWKQNGFYFPWGVLHLLQADPFSIALSLLQQWCLSIAWHWKTSSGWFPPGHTGVLHTNVPVLMFINRTASSWIGTWTYKWGHVPYSLGVTLVFKLSRHLLNLVFKRGSSKQYWIPIHSRFACFSGVSCFSLKLILNQAVNCWLKGHFSHSPITRMK